MLTKPYLLEPLISKFEWAEVLYWKKKNKNKNKQCDRLKLHIDFVTKMSVNTQLTIWSQSIYIF